MPKATLANWLSIGALGLIWGGTFMVVSVALEGYGPITVACARTTLGAFALWALMLATGRRFPPIDRRLLTFLVPAGLLSTAIPFLMLSWGQQFVPSAFAGISMAAIPLFVLPLAHIFSDEKLSARAFIGVCLGFLGAAVLIGPGLLNLGDDARPLAQLACVAAALCYASASIFTRQCPPMDPVALATASLILGSIVLLPIMFAVEGVPGPADRVPMVAILFLGLLPTGLATLLRVSVIRSAGSVFMSLVNYQVPLWAMVFGAMVLNELLPLRFFAALALILTGLMISQWPNLKRLIR